MTHKILVVDDESSIRELLGMRLTAAGFDVVFAANTAEAVEQQAKEQPDLILLDINLPTGGSSLQDGIEVLRDIRSRSDVPIIMLTARDEDESEVSSFDNGADNYIRKPINNFDLLLGRIKSRLRPRGNDVNVLISVGPLVIDVVGHEVRKNDTAISLTPLEFELLKTLALNPKKVYSRKELLTEVWDFKFNGDARLVNVHVQRLRSKVEDDPADPKIVLTVRGMGYRVCAS
ncbi:MAG: response regulator transcription factor [Actinomycetes bacterium]